MLTSLSDYSWWARAPGSITQMGCGELGRSSKERDAQNQSTNTEGPYQVWASGWESEPDGCQDEGKGAEHRAAQQLGHEAGSSAAARLSVSAGPLLLPYSVIMTKKGRQACVCHSGPGPSPAMACASSSPRPCSWAAGNLPMFLSHRGTPSHCMCHC